MFAALDEAVRRRAELLAERRRDRISEALRAALPRDVAIERTAEGVQLSARGLGRRLALESGLRAATGRRQ